MNWKRTVLILIIAFFACTFYQIKVIEPERYKEVYNSIVRQLDTIENKSLPDVTVSCNSVCFSVVSMNHFLSRIFHHPKLFI